MECSPPPTSTDFDSSEDSSTSSSPCTVIEVRSPQFVDGVRVPPSHPWDNASVDSLEAPGFPGCLPGCFLNSFQRFNVTSYSKDEAGTNRSDASLETRAASSQGFLVPPVDLPMPKPSLWFHQEQPFSFVNSPVTFWISPICFPKEISLESYTAIGSVGTPSGKTIYLGRINFKKGKGFADPDYFTGTFQTDQIGVHQIFVRVFNAVRARNINQKEIEGRSKINIFRDYLKESKELKRTFNLCPENDRPGVGGATEPFQPWGVAVNRKNNLLYFTNRNANSISCVNLETTQLMFNYPGNFLPPDYFSEGAPPSIYHLNLPTGIGFDEVNQRVLIADMGNHRIVVLTSTGTFLFTFGSHGTAPGEFIFPWDVAVDPSGTRIVVADEGNKRIQLFSRDMKFLGSFFPTEKVENTFQNYFTSPRGVVFSNDGAFIYVTDFNSHNVLQITVDMKKYRILFQEGVLSFPQGILVDAQDNLIICDYGNKVLLHVTVSSSDCKVVTGIYSVGDRPLDAPVNLALLEDAKVAVVELNGEVFTF